VVEPGGLGVLVGIEEDEGEGPVDPVTERVATDTVGLTESVTGGLWLGDPEREMGEPELLTVSVEELDRLGDPEVEPGGVWETVDIDEDEGEGSVDPVVVMVATDTVGLTESVTGGLWLGDPEREMGEPELLTVSVEELDRLGDPVLEPGGVWETVDIEEEEGEGSVDPVVRVL
jgi:hypothetical protein